MMNQWIEKRGFQFIDRFNLDSRFHGNDVVGGHDDMYEHGNIHL